jgi:hypothetical protein
MNITLTSSGLIKPGEFDSWRRSRQAVIRKTVGDIMRTQGRSIAEAAQANARSGLKGNKAWRSMRAKVYDTRPNDMPALKIGSRIPWLGAHEEGSNIRGPLLIPIIKLGPKAFRRLLNELNRAGNAYWVPGKKGQPVLMAENITEQGRVLGKFKSAERQRDRAAGGSGRLKRGQDIPIATLVPQVRLKKRLRFEQTVRSRVPALAAAIASALRA